MGIYKIKILREKLSKHAFNQERVKFKKKERKHDFDQEKSEIKEKRKKTRQRPRKKVRTAFSTTLSTKKKASFINSHLYPFADLPQ